MANKFQGLPAHSAEYFGDTRDHWWNLDYLELVAKRLSFKSISDVLDVGCGVGHWGQLLAKVLPRHARLRGVDREETWIERADQRAAAQGLADRCKYEVGAAEKLPFEAARFDLVTCQTVLIHVRDPGVVIDEMIRVARPGGLVLVAEPNNLANALILDTVTSALPVKTIMRLASFQFTCERGKCALGEGNNSIGDLVPVLFNERGLSQVQVSLSDKASTILPPYGEAAERAMREENIDFLARGVWIWDRSDTNRYFIAGGGSESAFEALWELAIEIGGRAEKALAGGTYSCAGGTICYLVSGRKAR